MHTYDGVKAEIKERVRQVNAQAEMRLPVALLPTRGHAAPELLGRLGVEIEEDDRYESKDPVLGPNQLFLQQDQQRTRTSSKLRVSEAGGRRGMATVNMALSCSLVPFFKPFLTLPVSLSLVSLS